MFEGTTWLLLLKDIGAQIWWWQGQLLSLPTHNLASPRSARAAVITEPAHPQGLWPRRFSAGRAGGHPAVGECGAGSTWKKPGGEGGTGFGD